MKSIFFLLLTTLILACKTGVSSEKTEKKQGLNAESDAIPSPSLREESVAIKDSIDPMNALFFIVVADTSNNYHFLHEKMLHLSKSSNIPVDKMGRRYNASKNLIALPENDADEIYAGNYFPRRFPSESFSLEYLNFYMEKSKDSTIALVAGIYEKESQADSVLTTLKAREKKAFKIATTIYMGCMH